jgi:glucan 1,3-beta-glucosidase
VTDFVFGAIGAYFKIPEIENPVDEILREYSNDIDLARIESFIFNIQQRDAPSYWYENIAHQGISAFGPSGYQVYRNVKDFGAKGTLEGFQGIEFFKWFIS